MFKSWAKYFGAVVALILVTGLAVVVLMVGANFLQSLVINLIKDAEWTTRSSVQANFFVRTVLDFYYVISGILFLGIFVLMEQRLVTSGVPKKLVLRRTSFSLGIELLILAFFQLSMMLYLPVVPIQVVLTVGETLFGIGLIYVGRRKTLILPWSKEEK